jgi:hypothetical protein
MAKPKSITESLAESLKRAVPATPLEAETPAIASVAEVPAPVVEATRKPASPLPALTRTTISMKATEQNRVDQILEVLRRCRRSRGGTTEAISIALRLCPLDEEQIGRAWDESRAEDRRKKKT